MNSYEKPNMILPICLHDTQINAIQVENDAIVFILENGIYTIDENQATRTGSAAVRFPKPDFDFCHVYCTDKNNHRQEWTISDFALKLQNENLTIDMVDETYGYNRACFGCDITINDEYFSCVTKIYHFGLVHYTWQEANTI